MLVVPPTLSLSLSTFHPLPVRSGLVLHHTRRTDETLRGPSVRPLSGRVVISSSTVRVLHNCITTVTTVRVESNCSTLPPENADRYSPFPPPLPLILPYSYYSPLYSTILSLSFYIRPSSYRIHTVSMPYSTVQILVLVPPTPPPAPDRQNSGGLRIYLRRWPPVLCEVL